MTPILLLPRIVRIILLYLLLFIFALKHLLAHLVQTHSAPPSDTQEVTTINLGVHTSLFINCVRHCLMCVCVFLNELQCYVSFCDFFSLNIIYLERNTNMYM